MNANRKYQYNMVIATNNDKFVIGELLTDKELKKMIKNEYIHPVIIKVKVYAKSCYYSFGVRFGMVATLESNQLYLANR